MQGLSGKVTVYAGGLDAGDRLFIAGYGESYGIERLKETKVITAKGEKLTTCSFSADELKGLDVKAFVWSENLGAKRIKDL